MTLLPFKGVSVVVVGRVGSEEGEQDSRAARAVVLEEESGVAVSMARDDTLPDLLPVV